MNNTIENTLKEQFRKAFPANSNIPTNTDNKHTRTIAIWLVIGLAIAFFSPHASTNSGIYNIGGQVIVNTGQPIRNWQELSYEEKSAIKAEAIQKFPEINDMGRGVSWTPITEWLASKGVKANNTRDLFRG